MRTRLVASVTRKGWRITSCRLALTRSITPRSYCPLSIPLFHAQFHLSPQNSTQPYYPKKLHIMVSLVYLEVYGVIIPLMAVLLSFIVPVSFLNKGLAGLIRCVEHPFAGNLTALSVLAIITSFSFMFDFLAWQDTFKARQQAFPDISLKLQFETKRLRLERNVYIHMLASVLCLSVKKIAQLTLPRTVTAAQPPVKTHGSSEPLSQGSTPPTSTHRTRQ